MFSEFSILLIFQSSWLSTMQHTHVQIVLKQTGINNRQAHPCWVWPTLPLDNQFLSKYPHQSPNPIQHVSGDRLSTAVLSIRPDVWGPNYIYPRICSHALKIRPATSMDVFRQEVSRHGYNILTNDHPSISTTHSACTCSCPLHNKASALGPIYIL